LARPAVAAEWRGAASDSEFVLFVTAAELKALNDEIVAFLLPRAQERLVGPTKRPPGSVPVEMLIFSFPVALAEREA
jgi:hypothetical protein